MEWVETQIIDGTVLTNRQNRQKRPDGRYLLPKCCQNPTMRATGLIVWSQPSLFEFSPWKFTFGTIPSRLGDEFLRVRGCRQTAGCTSQE